jgi:hypothetical protein
MPEAKFLKREQNESYLCNICSDQIEDDKIIALKCNPKKHIFCYDCISEWYIEVSQKKNKNLYLYSLNMCPICRKNGGLLPIYGDTQPIKNIHIFPKPKPVKKSDLENIPKINPNKLSHECGAKFSTKDGYCVAWGKNQYNGFCGVHKNLNK